MQNGLRVTGPSLSASDGPSHRVHRALGGLRSASALAFGFLIGVTVGLSTFGFTLLWPSEEPDGAIEIVGAGVPSGDGNARLVRSVFMTLHDANRTGNYAVLHALSAPSFQGVNSVDRLAQIFSNLRDSRADLSFAASSRPTWDQPPYIDAAGILWMKGTFSEVPFATRFALAFVKVAGDWKLVEIGIQRE